MLVQWQTTRVHRRKIGIHYEHHAIPLSLTEPEKSAVIMQEVHKHTSCARWTQQWMYHLPSACGQGIRLTWSHQALCFSMLQVQQQRFLSAAEHGGGGCQLSSKFSDSNVVAQPLSSAPEVHQHMFYAQMELWTSDALESTFPQHSRSIF